MKSSDVVYGGGTRSAARPNGDSMVWTGSDCRHPLVVFGVGLSAPPRGCPSLDVRPPQVLPSSYNLSSASTTLNSALSVAEVDWRATDTSTSLCGRVEEDAAKPNGQSLTFQCAPSFLPSRSLHSARPSATRAPSQSTPPAVQTCRPRLSRVSASASVRACFWGPVHSKEPRCPARWLVRRAILFAPRACAYGRQRDGACPHRRARTHGCDRHGGGGDGLVAGCL